MIVKILSRLTLCLSLLPGIVLAQDPESPQVNWAFSAFLGTGWYKVDNNRSIFILRVPPRQTVQTSSLSFEGKRKIGIEILYPVSIGYHNVDELPGFLDPENFGTASFTPGVQLEIPITESWKLRPTVSLGYGREFNSNSKAWIYQVGLKSRYQVITQNRLDWGFLAGLSYSGANFNSGKSSDLTARSVRL